MGPSPEQLAARAKVVARQLETINGLFCDWSLSARCVWLLEASRLTISIAPNALVQELAGRSLITISEAGRVSYDEQLIGGQSPPVDGVWTREDFKLVTDKIVIQTSYIQLADPTAAELLAERRSLALRAAGLPVLTKQWEASALRSLHDVGEEPKFAMVSTAFEPPRWPTSLRIITAISTNTTVHSLRFAEEVNRAASAAVQRITPLAIQLSGLNLRESLFDGSNQQVRSLEAAFGWGCKVIGWLPGEVCAAFTQLRACDASAEQVAAYREILARATSSDHAIKCPGEVPFTIAETLAEEPALLRRIGKDLGLVLEVATVPSANGGCDLLCWPVASCFGLDQGFEGALERYNAASEAARKTAGFQQLRLWAKGQPEEYLFENYQDPEWVEEVARILLLRGEKVVMGRR